MLAQQVYYDQDNVNEPPTPMNNDDFNSNCIHFENRLLKELEDMDDPLELFLEYINYINDISSASLIESKLKQVIERCIKYIVVLKTYDNDPRFIKIWLFYLDTFVNDQFQDNLIFMFTKGLGNKLALLYMEWANLFWNMKQFENSLLILQYGINNNARPVKRLHFMLNDLQVRLTELNVTLTTKVTWDAVLTRLTKDYRPPDFITNDIVAKIDDLPTIRQSKPLQIFQDTTQELNNKKPVHSTKKAAVVCKTIKIGDRKPEKIHCNFDLIYNDAVPFGEVSFEQLLLIRRAKRKPSFSPSSNKRNAFEIIESPPRVKKQSTFDEMKRRQVIESMPSSQPPVQKMAIFNNKDTIKYKTHTSVLPLKEEDDNNLTTNNTNTVTFFSKDAMNEVYSMFNQNLDENNNPAHNNSTNNNIPNHNDNNTTGKFTIFGNVTQDFTRNNIDDLTEVKKTPMKVTQIENVQIPHSINNNNINNNKSNNETNMSPIQEKTENSISHTPVKPTSYLNSQSSPFLSQPAVFNSQFNNFNYSSQSSNLPLIISHPLSDGLRSILLSQISPQLSTYDSFFQYNEELNKSDYLDKIHRRTSITKRQSKDKILPMINFDKEDDFYRILSELGRGGYAIVYLAESSIGSLSALKVEKPGNSWEYYILKQIELRLHDEIVLESIITAKSLHLFRDESYLVLNYAKQGTILDLVNLIHDEDGSNLEENVCIFLSIELIKIIEKLHEIGIIHGDLKPDNCMIRFLQSSEDSLGDYNKYGDAGWDKKGLYLIDFGRSFDLSLFQQGTQFKCDWITDKQDCYEMRHGMPWTYECDYYGLAGVIHCMLFGEFIETVGDKRSRVKLRSPLKRSWQKEIWLPLFDLLLNSGEYNLPITSQIKIIRLQMEDYLMNDLRHSHDLRTSILRIERELNRHSASK